MSQLQNTQTIQQEKIDNVQSMMMRVQSQMFRMQVGTDEENSFIFGLCVCQLLTFALTNITYFLAAELAFARSAELTTKSNSPRYKNKQY